MTNRIDPSDLEARYEAASAQVRKHQKLEKGQAGVTVLAALAYGDALEENAMFRTVSHWGKLVCIAALFIFPNILVWHVLL